MVCPNCGRDSNQCDCALDDVSQPRAGTPATSSPVDLSLAANWPDEAAPASGADDDRAALLQFLRDFTSSAPPVERPPPTTPEGAPRSANPIDLFMAPAHTEDRATKLPPGLAQQNRPSEPATPAPEDPGTHHRDIAGPVGFPGPGVTPGTGQSTGPSVAADPAVTRPAAPSAPAAPFGSAWTSPRTLQPSELLPGPGSRGWRKPALMAGAFVLLSGLLAGAMIAVGSGEPVDEAKPRPSAAQLSLPARGPGPSAMPIVRRTVAPLTRQTVSTTAPVTKPTAAPTTAPVTKPTIARTAPATRPAAAPTTAPARRAKAAAPTTAVAASKAKPARPTSLLSLPATMVMEKALSDGRKLGWARVTVTARGQSFPEPLTVTQVSGPSLGAQTTEGDGFRQVIEVLPGGGVYIKANSDGLNNIMSLPSGDISRLSGWWLSVGPLGNADSSFADGITLPSNLSQFNFAGPLVKTGPTTERGQKVIAITGHIPGPGGKEEPATLYVSMSANPLPVEEVGADGYGDTIVAAFGHWGEVSELSPPRNAIPLAFEGNGDFLPVPAVPDLPHNLCMAEGPSEASPAAAAYVSSLNAVVPLWISITQSLASNGYVALPENFVAEASADSELFKALERVNFPTQDVARAAGAESALQQYIAELDLIIRNGASPSASATLGEFQSRLDSATRLLRKALGMSGTYDCQFINPTATADPSVALRIDRTGGRCGPQRHRCDLAPPTSVTRRPTFLHGRQ